MSDPLSQIILNIRVYIKALQNRGLGGNVIEEAPTQLADEEKAGWTGKRYRLVFCGESPNYRLELREFQDGVDKTVWETTDKRQFDKMLQFFVVEEG